MAPDAERTSSRPRSRRCGPTRGRGCSAASRRCEREPDLEKALIDAHTLAGTLGSFGLADASAAARDAERAATAGDRDALAAAVRRSRALERAGALERGTE